MTASAISIRPWVTPATTSVIGISTPWARASSSTGPADFTPSVTCDALAAASASGMPRPRFSPKVRLRDSGELQVATRSPIPARPASVSWSAPSAVPSLAISARPGNEQGPGVVPEPHPDRDAHRERDHVLDGAAELAADHVRVGVGPEVRRVAGLLQVLGHGVVGAGDHGGRVLAGGYLPRQVRAGDHRDP